MPFAASAKTEGHHLRPERILSLERVVQDELVLHRRFADGLRTFANWRRAKRLAETSLPAPVTTSPLTPNRPRKVELAA